MKLSHNTMTYKTPKKWWMRLVYWMARCQSKPYKEQDCDGYDIRIYPDKNMNVEFRHGFTIYDASDLYEFLNYCNMNNKPVRLMLESRYGMSNDTKKRNVEQWFCSKCSDWEKNYENIRFYGGRNVGTWEVIYSFKWRPEEYEYHASVDGKKWYNYINDICPWLYAKLHNKENLKKEKEDACCLYDFL